MVDKDEQRWTNLILETPHSTIVDKYKRTHGHTLGQHANRRSTGVKQTKPNTFGN